MNKKLAEVVVCGIISGVMITLIKSVTSDAMRINEIRDEKDKLEKLKNKAEKTIGA